jgi:hydrogenase/urease accessory protein HupE
MRRRILAYVLASIVTGTVPAWSHTLAPSLLAVRERGGGALEVEWRTPIVGTPGAELRPVVPEGCVPNGEPELGRFDAAYVVRWRVECSPAGLVGRRFGVAGVVENRADVLIRVELDDGRRFRSVLRADQAEFVVPERESKLDVFIAYLRLGIEHILTGFDHLLFVLGLLLLIPGRRSLLWTLTSFTLGHSVTLSLAALGFVHFSPPPAEAAIAATILVLAVELTRPTSQASLLRRRPWAMAAVFGLLHGLGFAGALAEVGLPQGDVPLALGSFNVGIEIGQIVFVAAVIAVSAILARARVAWPRPLRLAPAYAIGSLSAFWLFARLAVVFRA